MSVVRKPRETKVRFNCSFFLDLYIFILCAYLFYFMYLVCFACMFVCASHVCSVQGGQKRALHSLGTSVTNHCELPRGCWDLNLGSLGEQPELLTAELLFSTYVMEEC